MSLLNLPPDLQDNFELVTRPRRFFASSSFTGVAGSVRVFPDITPTVKEMSIGGDASKFVNDDLESIRRAAVLNFRTGEAAAQPAAMRGDRIGLQYLNDGDSFTLLAPISAGGAGTGVEYEFVASPVAASPNRVQIVYNRPGGTVDDAGNVSFRALGTLLALALRGEDPDGRILDFSTNPPSLIGDSTDIVYASSGGGQAGVDSGVRAGYILNAPWFRYAYSVYRGVQANQISFSNTKGELIRSSSNPLQGLPVGEKLYLRGGRDSRCGGVDLYLDRVSEAPANVKKGKRMEIIRFEPSFKLTSNTLRKQVITNILYPHYNVEYSKYVDFSFTNYNTLNFFDSPKVPSNSVLIYPSTASAGRSSVYQPTGSFSMEFYINPRYTTDTSQDAFHAGTIFHVSSTFALSLVTGSNVDLAGRPTGYRLMLQLSHSADISPSEISLNKVDDGTYRTTKPGGETFNPYDLIFLSDDNSLTKDVWDYVGVRWGTTLVQAGTGSFIVNGKPAGEFVVPSASLTPDSWGPGKLESRALFVGNYYEGQNQGLSAISMFFNPSTAYRQGLMDMWNKDASIEEPREFNFRHPLNAELHELKIFNKYRTISSMEKARKEGLKDLNEDGLIFFVPPFFVRETNERDVLITPFQSARKKTLHPFNIDISFGVGGHLLNLENFVKDLKQGNFPRLLNLSASVIQSSTDWLSANDHFYATGSIRKRNLSILPCDNGKFIPNFSILDTAVSASSMPKDEQLALFVDDRGTRDLSIVSLRKYIQSTGSDSWPEINQTDIVDDLFGATPENPFVVVNTSSNQPLCVFMETRDPDSNEVTFFDISNIFYGEQVYPNTFHLSDPSVTGSGGKVKITLKDHNGNLYRADCTGSTAQWNSVGNILYEEGLVTVKSPVLPMFGTDAFSCGFRGKNRIFSRRINIPLDPGSVTDSSNPSYKRLRPSSLAPDLEETFTYVTDVDILDENLNVVAKATFSQPIVKRESDNFIIRCKMDF